MARSERSGRYALGYGGRGPPISSALVAGVSAEFGEAVSGRPGAPGSPGIVTKGGSVCVQRGQRVGPVAQRPLAERLVRGHDVATDSRAPSIR
jgi:hypothetical protein